MNPYLPFGSLTLPDLPLDTTCQREWSIGNLHCNPFSLAEIESEPLSDLQADYFKLDWQDAPLPDLECSRVSSVSDDEEVSAKVDNVEPFPNHEEDVWQLPYIYTKAAPAGLTSWDTFVNHTSSDPIPLYISEAGPLAFDRLILKQCKNTEYGASKIVKRDALLASLFELAAGRRSALFRYNQAKKDSVQRTEHFTTSGVSEDLLDQVITQCAQSGCEFQKLRNYVQEISKGSGRQNSMHIALVGAVSVVLYAVEVYLEGQRPLIRSILQAQVLFDRPSYLLRSLTSLIRCTLSSSNPSISVLISEAQVHSEGSQGIEDMTHEILARTAEPQLRTIDSSIGLKESLREDDGSSETLLSALPVEVRQMLAETRESLTLLRENKSDHPLLHSVHTKDIYLRWHNTWEEINDLHNRAVQYETRLKDTICFMRRDLVDQTQDPPAAKLPHASPTGERDDRNLLGIDAMELFDSLPDSTTDAKQEKLYKIVQNALKDDQLSGNPLRPPLDHSLALSLSPLLAVQHRLLSFAAMDLLFETYKLRLHLHLQYRFHLFGDGDFSSRLGHALFDPNQASGEGRRKTNTANTGLRLQSRDTWPPASSELRLVLMSILSDSIASRSHTRRDEAKLSDSIFFAIRNLSDEDLEKCRDADSIHALDFLRLQYKPPNSLLEAILTPKSMELYDRIFQFLLTLLRVKSVAENLLRAVSSRNSTRQTHPDQRFRLEIQHFTAIFASWMQDVVINPAWQELDSTVAKVEKCIEARDFDGVLFHSASLAFVRDLHERTLTKILKCLLLNQKQSEVMAPIHVIMGCILRFAKADRNGNDDASILRLREDFRDGIVRFLRGLKGLAKDDGGGTEKRVNVHEQLLLRLDMLGYYE